MLESYSTKDLKAILANEKFPCALLDIDNFDKNLKTIGDHLRRAGKSMRLCTKSVRVPDLVKRVTEQDFVNGVFVSSAAEALYCAEVIKIKDIMLGYPLMTDSDANDLCAAKKIPGTKISAMVDAAAQLEVIEAAASTNGVILDFIVDVDMADSFLGNKVGVYRSPLRDADDIIALIKIAEQRCTHLHYAGIMGYEAQNASIDDRSGFMRWIKKRSRVHVNKQRQQIFDSLTRAGYKPSIVNGGGSGCFQDTAAEPAVTELGIGSLLFKPHMFDGFASLRPFTPSMFFAIMIVRKPCENIATAFSGGYVSSGVRALPVVHSPANVVPLKREGFGEVQTPLKFDQRRMSISPGDVALCRFGKAGEPMEFFNEVLIVSEGKIVDRDKTYRGLGKKFF
nr:alanine racemase [Candidatus Sigynarchaeota archaeon]